MDNKSNSFKSSILMAFSLALGCVIGWGAFVFPGAVLLPKAGIYGVIMGVIIAAFIAMFTCVNYIGLSRFFPESDSSYALVKNVFGMDHAYFLVWSLLLAYIALLWSNASAIAYLGRFFLGDAQDKMIHYHVMGYDVFPSDIIGAVLLVLIAAYIISRGYGFTLKLICVLSSLLIISVVILFVGVVSATDASALFATPFSVSAEFSRSAQIMSVAVLAPWLFVGFETVSHITGETKLRLNRLYITAGCAIIAGMFIYIMLALIINSEMPPGYRSWQDYAFETKGISTFSDMPAYYSIHSKMGDFGTAVLGVAFFCALFSSVLGEMMVATRTMSIMAEDHIAPASFGKTNDKGMPINALGILVLLCVPVFFAGVNVIGWAVDIATLAITIVYGYISVGTFTAAGNRIRFRITGFMGAILSFGIFFVLIIPGIYIGTSLVKEDYLILSIWSLAGLICYRFVLSMDREFRFGKSMLMWLMMFFLLFYSTNMWTHLQLEQELESITDKTDISQILLTNNLIRTIVVILALIILFELFTIMIRREKELDKKIIDAESKDRARNNLLSNMSHDIRTPLNAIVGFTNLALEDKTDTATMAEYLSKIRVSGEHLVALINDVLEITRIESGKFEIREEAVNLPEMFARIRKDVLEKMDTSDYYFDMDVRMLENENVLCDSSRMYQALIYLISNGFRYSHEGGQVVLGVTQISPAEEGRATYEFYVKDNGDGMSRKVVSQISDNFMDDDSYKMSDSGGSLLGMILTKKIVEHMGGRFEIESTEDNGTEVYITIELGVTEEEGEPSFINYADCLAGKRALVVDDIMVNRQIAMAMLDLYGVEADEARDGEEAIKIMSSALPGHYDVILMDIQMPRINGFDAAHAIRELPEPVNASVPILAMTANVFDEDREKAYEVGMNGFISKPIDRDYLLRTMAGIFNTKNKGE